MKNISKIKLFLIFLILFSSGQQIKINSSSNSDNPIKIDLAGLIDKEIKSTLSEIANDIEYIKLETTTKCYVGRVSKIYFSEQNIFIISGGRLFGENIYMFDKSGKFIRKIGVKGKGPGEYTNALDIQVDSENQIIFILNNSPSELLLYSLNGKYIRKISLFDFDLVDRFMLLEQNNIMIYQPMKYSSSKNDFQFNIIDYDGKLNYDIPIVNLKNVRPVTGIADKAFFHIGNDSNEFSSANSDTIYRLLSPRNYKAVYYYYFGKHRCPDDIFHNVVKWNDERSNYLLKSWETISRNYLFNHFTIHDEFYLSIFSIKDSKFIFNYKFEFPRVPNPDGLINDIDGGHGITFLFFMNATNDNKLVKSIQAIDFIDMLEKDYFKSKKTKFPEKQKMLIELAKGMDENDNPVLQVIHLK
ncbi:MAG: 6-bladed beta-propeller [Bacteroidales bacterium]|nr:6-bladed beta-propeller [Bacteroidales bacterium]